MRAALQIFQRLLLVVAVTVSALWASPRAAVAEEINSIEAPEGVQIPPEEEALLRARIDELFPNEPREPLPEPDALDRTLGALSNVGYVPIKVLTAITYTFSGFFHHAAMMGSEGRRIFYEGWSGDWVVTGKHLAGAEPLDLVGPDRRFPGHNPVARRTFIQSWYLLHSSLPYRGLPKGSEIAPSEAAGEADDSAAPAGQTPPSAE